VVQDPQDPVSQPEFPQVSGQLASQVGQRHRVRLARRVITVGFRAAFAGSIEQGEDPCGVFVLLVKNPGPARASCQSSSFNEVNVSSRVGASQGINSGHRVQDDKTQPAADRHFDHGAATALRVVIPDVPQPAHTHDRVVYFLPVQPVTAGEFRLSGR
jgi:hypothetical protein